MSSFYDKLRQAAAGGSIRLDEPMSGHTTFRVGGPADYFAEPETAGELADVLALCRAEHMDYCVLGNGSNLLVGDKGYRGVIVALGSAWTGIKIEENRLTAGAGALLPALARRALQANLTGLEFAAGIPGTVGGAVVMNAGAYGSEMASVLACVTVLDPETGEVKNLTLPELELGYRTSSIAKLGCVVLSAEMELQPGDGRKIAARMEELNMQRRAKQPLEYPSAGSTFKRPEGYFAGKLIQDAGLRGFTVGGAQVSEKHCGFVINRGGATASDVMELCRAVRQRVQEQFGVELEMEVKILGEF